MADKELLADWLRDAYAMENQAVEILEKQVSRLDHYPDLRLKIEQHLEVTRRQADRVRDCLQRLGTDTSALKTGMGKITGTLSAFMTVLSSDEVVKNTIADYAFEHFEIANYRALIAVADDFGEPEIKQVCSDILQEELEMAGWLEDHIPAITSLFVQRQDQMEFRQAKG